MPDTSDSFKVVRWYDPEIEEHCDLSAVVEYRSSYDLDVLAIPAAARPIVFTCRLLTREQRRHVYALSTDEVKWEGAFQYGVTSIENLPRGNGRVETVIPDRHNKRSPMSDAELDKLKLGDDDVHEIGRVILERSRLGKGVPLNLEPLPSSRRAWLSVATAAASRRAEQSTDQQTDSDD